MILILNFHTNSSFCYGWTVFPSSLLTPHTHSNSTDEECKSMSDADNCFLELWGSYYSDIVSCCCSKTVDCLAGTCKVAEECASDSEDMAEGIGVVTMVDVGGSWWVLSWRKSCPLLYSGYYQYKIIPTVVSQLLPVTHITVLSDSHKFCTDFPSVSEWSYFGSTSRDGAALPFQPLSFGLFQ